MAIFATCCYGRREWPGPAIVHIEFKSADFARTSAFYAKLFDWKTEQNASGSYMKLGQRDGPSARLGARRPGAGAGTDRLPGRSTTWRRSWTRSRARAVACWCAACRSRAAARSALFADPDGNVLGLWRRKAGQGRGGRRRRRRAAAPPAPAKPADGAGQGRPPSRRAKPEEEESRRVPRAVRRPPAVAALVVGGAGVRGDGAGDQARGARGCPGPQVAFVRFADRPRRLRRWRGCACRCARATSSACSCAAPTAARRCCSTSSAIAHLPVGIATLLNYTAPVFTAIYAAAVPRRGDHARDAGRAGADQRRRRAGDRGDGAARVARLRAAGSWSACCRRCCRAPRSRPSARCARPTGRGRSSPRSAWRAPLIAAVPALRGLGSARRPGEWVTLAAVGLTSVVGQLLMTHALRYVRAAVGGVIAQLTPVTSLALGWALFGDRIGAPRARGRGADAGRRQRGRLPGGRPRGRSRRRVEGRRGPPGRAYQ